MLTKKDIVYTDKEIEAIKQEWYERGIRHGKQQLLSTLHELLRTDDLLHQHVEIYHEKD